MTAAIAKRKVGESWREAVRARAGTGAPAVLADFDARVAAGTADTDAAFRALAAAGLLWTEREPSGPRRPPDQAAAEAGSAADPSPGA